MITKMKWGFQGKVLVFCDEKDFHVDKHINRCNSRYVATFPATTEPSVKFIGCSKHPAKVMILGYVRSEGRAFPPVWLPKRVTRRTKSLCLSTPSSQLLTGPIARMTVWVQDWGLGSGAQITLQTLLRTT